MAPSFSPSLHSPRPASPPHRTPLAVCPLCPCPGLLQGAKLLTVPSLCPGRGHSEGPGMGRAESQACSCSRVWFLRGKQPGSADTGLALALCQTALGRHVCLHKGGWGCGLSPPGFPWFLPIPWLCPLRSPQLHPLGSPHLHPSGSPRAPSPHSWEGRDPMREQVLPAPSSCWRDELPSSQETLTARLCHPRYK